jgi:hypothetical protein
LRADDSALFPFRFCAVHAKDAHDCQLQQFFEVPLLLKVNPSPLTWTTPAISPPIYSARPSFLPAGALTSAFASFVHIGAVCNRRSRNPMADGGLFDDLIGDRQDIGR